MPRAEGFEKRGDLALVVDSAAGKDFSIADRRLKRRRLPEVERVGRLNVVVSVKEDVRRVGRRSVEGSVSEHNGMPGRRVYLRTPAPSRAAQSGDPLRGLLHVILVRRGRSETLGIERNFLSRSIACGLSPARCWRTVSMGDA